MIFSLPSSRYIKHEPCRSRNRVKQAKMAVNRRLPSSRPSFCGKDFSGLQNGAVPTSFKLTPEK